MRRDRNGDLVDDDQEQEPPHDPLCRDGWIGTDPAGRPIPCTACRPHLPAMRDRLDRKLHP